MWRQVVFTQGLEDLSLARSGLEALIVWKKSIEPNKFEPILKAVIPLLNPYLQSKSKLYQNLIWKFRFI
jgi:hypothetical protein